MSNHSLQESAYRAIRSYIVTCRFHPGQRLKAAEVAAQLELSRMPVRQAFDRLRLEGLVTIHPRRGVEVRGFHAKELLEIVEARLINECHAAGLAAERATDADIVALEEMVLRSSVVTNGPETRPMIQQEQEFHDRLAAMTGNTVLAGILRNLQDRAFRFWFISVSDLTQRRSVVAQHADIVSAIAVRDRAAAAASMGDHIEDFRRSVLQQPGLVR